MKAISLVFAALTISSNAYGAGTMTIATLPSADVEDNPVCFDATSGKLGVCANSTGSELLPVGIDWDGNEIGIYVSLNSYISHTGYSFSVDLNGNTNGVGIGDGDFSENPDCLGVYYIDTPPVAGYMAEVLTGVPPTQVKELYYFPKNASPIDKSGKTFYKYIFGWGCEVADVSAIDLYAPIPNDEAETGVHASYAPPVYWKLR